jgi:hypothetical protein
MGSAFLLGRLRAGLCAVAAAGALFVTGAEAQQTDRERAQMKLMQQQVQHLQSENASLQTSLSEAQAKSKQEVDQVRKRETSALGQIARMKEEARARGDELDGLRSNLATTNEKLTAADAENERLRSAVAERDEALKKAGEQKRLDDAAAALLQERLKLQTARGDLCETRHAGLTAFSEKLVKRYETDRLRLCEPVTGIWKVREEKDIQALRDQLYDFRLDVPAEQAQKP